MVKLIYKTKHNKSWGGYQSFCEHKNTENNDIFPSADIQQKATTLVDDKLRELVDELEKLGYDTTKAKFQIYVK